MVHPDVLRQFFPCHLGFTCLLYDLTGQLVRGVVESTSWVADVSIVPSKRASFD